MIEFKQISALNAEKDMVIPFYKGDVEDVSNYVSIENPDFDGSFSSFQIFYGKTGNRIYLLGLGEKKDAVKIEQAFHKFCFETKKYWKNNIQIKVDKLSSEEIKKTAIGMQLATYQIGQFKSEPIISEKITVALADVRDNTDAIVEGKQIGETINRIKALVDAPANHKTPEFLGQWAIDSAAESNYKCTVLHQKELVAQKFDAVLAVGQGSNHPPVLIINEYLPKKDKGVDIGLVGKGITFDTGGLSIKPSQNLHYMKSDMGGAAVVLGAVEVAARLKLDINIVGVVASAENAVDASSYRPGDVINSYSGKTIEIIDTDAEGRLVMADALSFIIKKYHPEQLIDLATLTGSVVRTLGFAAAGMFTTNNEMAAQMSRIGAQVHERVWRLPLYEDFESDLHSDIADIRNFSGKPIAGAINAAKFLESFTQSHNKWMHLDIAGVAFGDSNYSKMKSASGYGIQLLTAYFKSLN